MVRATMRARSSSIPVLAGLLLMATVAPVHADPSESPLDSAQRLEGQGAAGFDDTSLVVRLRAIRGAPFGRAPETQLEALVSIAAGRSSASAPAAMVAVHRIAERLDHASLDAREADMDAITRAERALRALAGDATARADIRRLADLSAVELAALRAP